MSYHVVRNMEDLEKLGKFSEQNEAIKRQKLIDKVNKQNLNYNLTEKYKPLTKAQEEQSNLIKEGQLKQAIQLNEIQLKQAEQLQAIEDQTNQIQSLALPPPPSPPPLMTFSPPPSITDLL